MKHLFFLSLASVLTLPFQAQVKQERNVPDFTSVSAASGIQVILTLSDKASLAFEAEEDVLSKLRGEVRNNTLFIDCKGDCNSRKGMVAYVSTKALKGIIAKEAADVKVTNVLKEQHLSVIASEAAKVELEIASGDLKVNETGASTVVVKGRAARLDLVLKGASSFKGKDFEVGDITALASGASTAKLNARESLNVVAKEASSVIYSGAPKDIKADAQEASTIKKAS